MASEALSYVNSTRALAYLTERGEDALHAVKGALGSGSSKYLDAVDAGAVRKQLESTNDNERLEGLKHVVALISKGRDATPFLASVFKLSSSTSLEVRKLVYIVVLRYAPQHPDLALLSINSFQRDLTEPNPLIRGMALRALSGMGVKAAWSIVAIAVGKAVRDTHPYVRRVAAYALMRCYQMDHSNRDVLMEHLGTLLRDRSPQVLGPAVATYLELCPEQWDLLHRHFRKLCYALADMDEWSQPMCVDLLVRYARTHLAAPEPDRAAIDSDLALLLDHCEPLLSSMNAASALAAARALLLLGPTQRHKPAIHAMVRRMRTSHDLAYVVTLRLLALCSTHTPLLVPHMPVFYVRADDPEHLALVKLRVLVQLVQEASAKAVADELVVYTQAASAVAVESITAIGQVACRYESAAGHCLKLLIGVAQDASIDTVVASRAVQVAKMLMAAIPQVTSDKVALRIVAQFALRLFVPLAQAGRRRTAPPPILVDSPSRTAALWMLGQYCDVPFVPHGSTHLVPGATLCQLIVPDVLRCLVAHWHKEHPSVQCQTLTLSAKAIVVIGEQESSARVRTAVQTLHYAVLALGNQSQDADVRDRARFYAGLTRRFAEDEALPSGSDDVEDYLHLHQRLDRLRLPGVRLRRPQVKHVLFSHDANHAASMASQLTLDAPEQLALGGMATWDVRLRGWRVGQVPDWADPATLPPAIIRMPEANAARPDLSNVRSIASSGAPSSPRAPPPPPEVEKVVLQPREAQAPARPAAWNARHANLDAFFDDDESSDGASLGDPAAEDEEYEVSDSEVESDDPVA